MSRPREAEVLRMPPVLDVTIVLMSDGYASTAIMPAEIFHSAGMLWDMLHGRSGRPLFRVRTVSIRGTDTTTPYGIGLQPQGSIDDVERTDIVIVPTSGLDLT